VNVCIDALRILHERGRAARCAIIGDGEERTALAEQVARSGLAQHVDLHGMHSRSEVIDLLQRATAFVRGEHRLAA
jgi:glycosyltransferase involved in cell wall biosynthesis